MYEVMRRLSNMMAIGVICEVNTEKMTAKVDINGMVSDEIPILAKAGVGIKRAVWYEVGEQVLVVFPGGFDGGVILGSIYSKKIPEPSIFGKGIDVVEYRNGTRVWHDADANRTYIHTGGEVEVNAARVSMTAEMVSITGNLHVEGKITDTKGSISDLYTVDSAGDTYQR